MAGMTTTVDATDELYGHFRKLEGQYANMAGAIADLRADQKATNTVINEIKTALTELKTSRGPGYHEVARTASSVTTAAAVVAGLLIWVILAVTSAPQVRLEERQSNLRGDIEKLEALVPVVTILNERVKVMQVRLDSPEFVKGWQATITAPGS